MGLFRVGDGLEARRLFAHRHDDVHDGDGDPDDEDQRGHAAADRVDQDDVEWGPVVGGRRVGRCCGLDEQRCKKREEHDFQDSRTRSNGELAEIGVCTADATTADG